MMLASAKITIDMGQVYPWIWFVILLFTVTPLVPWIADHWPHGDDDETP